MKTKRQRIVVKVWGIAYKRTFRQSYSLCLNRTI